MGIKDAWNTTSETSYWRVDPTNESIRWHVAFHRGNTFGSVKGQVLEADGWYWWTADWDGNRFSSMFGPFSSDVAAMADCSVSGEAREGRG
jgi:hypothetical protein